MTVFVYLDAPDHLKEVKIKADINPQELLAGAMPRLLDEWQTVPQLWDTIRYEADHRKGFGHFILTESSVPLQQEYEEVIKHTGTGRFGRLNMRPMSLFESGESRGEISLAQLFDEPSTILGHSNINLSELAFLTCRGGWPSAIEMDREIALVQAYDYCEAVRVNHITGNMTKIVATPFRARREQTFKVLSNIKFTSDEKAKISARAGTADLCGPL